MTTLTFNALPEVETEETAAAPKTEQTVDILEEAYLAAHRRDAQLVRWFCTLTGRLITGKRAPSAS